jgi:universal stress protein E
MARGFKRILFAVKDVDQVTPATLRKLASLALRGGARLELYHALTESIVVDRARADRSGKTLDAVFADIAAEARRKLERKARSSALRGIKVTAHVDWDYPAHEAIVRRAVATRADLVAVAVEPHRLGARLFLRNTDWELIRDCPTPLLLMKGTRSYLRPAVLVAVDPFHAADKPASLDRQLLAVGQRLAKQHRGTLHAVHAWLPLAVSVPSAASMPAPAWVPEDVEARHATSIRKAFDRLVARAGVAPARRYCISSTVPDALDQALARSRATVLVMGAVSRRGLKRLFIGNTAEREIDRANCDVLVVKPVGFRTRVPARGQTRPLMIGPVPL